jgi:hypothetical protein
MRETHTHNRININAYNNNYKQLLKGNLGSNGDLGAIALDGDLAGEVAGLAANLDLSVQERLLYAMVGHDKGKITPCHFDKRRELCRATLGERSKQLNEIMIKQHTKAAMSKISSWTGWVTSMVNDPDFLVPLAATLACCNKSR